MSNMPDLTLPPPVVPVAAAASASATNLLEACSQLTQISTALVQRQDEFTEICSMLYKASFQDPCAFQISFQHLKTEDVERLIRVFREGPIKLSYSLYPQRKELLVRVTAPEVNAGTMRDMILELIRAGLPFGQLLQLIQDRCSKFNVVDRFFIYSSLLHHPDASEQQQGDVQTRLLQLFTKATRHQVATES